MRAVPLCAAVALLAAPLAGQYRPGRSSEYQFAASTADARALWVNPGGLAVDYAAAVMGEVTLDRLRTGDLAFAQVTAGFNSRGVAFAYRRDSYGDTLSGHTWRVGVGRAFEGLAIGAALALHSNGDGPTQRGLDLGLRYRLLPAVELAAVVGDLGEPEVNFVPLNVHGTAGLGWQPSPALRVDAEATVTAVDGQGTVRSWRGGLGLGAAGLRLPFRLQAVVDLDQRFDLTRMTLAVTVGGRDRGVLAVSAPRPFGGIQIDGLSLAGIASRVPN